MNKPIAKTPLVKLIPLLVRGVAPAATAITLGLSPATTVSAPGDLDLSFGDFGRVGPITDFAGPAWSTQAVGTDGTLIAGGEYCDYYCSYYSYYHSIPPGFSSFMSELSGDGSDSGFVADELQHMQTFNTTLLADGSIIAVGRSSGNGNPALTVAKLTHTGALDASFGDAGVFRLATTQQTQHVGTSVTVDADGRIVVSGSQYTPDASLVVRLQANGVLDESFGTSGIYKGPASFGAKIVGTGSGYRVETSDCAIFGLTAAGKLDTTFGTAGTANSHPSEPLSCISLALQPDGGLLAVGANGSHGYATRLLANGAADGSFSGSAVTAGIAYALAVSAAQDGSGTIVVAGTDAAGTSNAVVMRLQASGQVDTTFGQGGTTLIDLPSEFGTSAHVHDLLWRADGSVTAAGGDTYSDRPFVVRLLGAGGAGVPGVLGAPQPNVTTNEPSHEVIVKVQRTGGAAGIVSVAYKTIPAVNLGTATSGKDFTAVAGRLTWHDGDTADQEIHVPILSDSTTEESEFFRVQLSDPAGGAGLGTRNATVEIQPDGSPYGLFSVAVDSLAVDEGNRAQLSVSRDWYTSGAVSVTLTPVAGTALAGSDFDPTPETISWADGEGGAKTVTIDIPADGMGEGPETFTVKLSDPTGGALIGPRSTGQIRINASTGTSGGGGGGAFGGLGLLFLGVAKLLQSLWASVRKRVPYGA